VAHPNISDNPADSISPSWIPTSDAERHAIRQQLDRILDHPSFKNSKRYPNLLRYIVEHTLKGETHLKERVLGVEVFGRDPSYDTNEDPIVRIAAGEIRKRIAQYYHERGHEGELRIDLPLGSYHAEYQLPDEITSTEPVHPIPVEVQSAVGELLASLRLLRPRRYIYLVVALASLAVLVKVTWVKPPAASSPPDDFWSPVLQDFWSPALKSTDPIFLCVGEPNLAGAPNGEPTVSDFINTTDHVSFSEASAVFRVGKFLTRRGVASRLQAANAMSLADLRRGPMLLVGGADNAWTLRIVEPLRFHFVAQSGQTPTMIEDRTNPSQKDWSINLGEKYSQLTQDYAIVARFASNPMTDEPVVVAGGLGENGTLAAAQFVTEAKFAQDLAKVAPADWKKKNVEIVITTQVIDEKPGPPRILATYFW
jgi:hypothetical protein